jgi:carbamoyltransferase
MRSILGIAAYYHDSAACLLEDGHIRAAAQEERFSRKRHDDQFPSRAIRWCLDSTGRKVEELDAIVFYEKPLLKFERLLETYLAHAPRGIRAYLKAMPVWLGGKLFLKQRLRDALRELAPATKSQPPILFTEHHQSHAASAFFPSPFQHAAILCMDGVGEWATTSAWRGNGNELAPLWQIDFPHSLGLFYSAFTYFTGFKVNSGEYKMMGLAPYGEPKYVQTLLDHVIEIRDDGSFRLNLDLFDYTTGLRMTHPRMNALFGEPRRPETSVTQREMDLARSVQEVTELAMVRLARTLRAETGLGNLCLAGGVALNCVGNGRLHRERIFDHMWIQPAAGDAGGAVGAAYAAWHTYAGEPRTSDGSRDAMRGGFLGPTYAGDEVAAALTRLGATFERLEPEQVIERTVEALSAEKVVGWFQGAMEFGPRALGGRSILADPRSPRMQSVLNLKIKFRESFRPFAPSVLEERVADWFELETPSPYMLIVADVKRDHLVAMSTSDRDKRGIELLKVPRSKIPAVTHVDNSARIQTVSAGTNPRYHALIAAFERTTGCPVLVNTSFNVRGEPIVCTPEDAYRCFMRTDMDVLVIEDFILEKAKQPPFVESDDWRKTHELD